MLNGLDLFSGIGGITLALDGMVRPIAYCENDPYCQAVLLSRMRDRRLPLAPIWDDVRSLLGCHIREPVDIITGGFPCQDISENHVGKGLAGNRSGLFFEIMRLAKELQPQFIFLENVRNIRAKGLGRIAGSLADISYDCRWDILPAYYDTKFFEGERWFCLAKAQSVRLENRGLEIGAEATIPENNGFVSNQDWDPYADPMVGASDGISPRSHRIRALGNAVVPIQARKAFKKLMGIKS